MFVDYTSKDELKAFVEALKFISLEEKAKLQAAVLAKGLMLPQGIGAKALMFIARLKSKADGGYAVLSETYLTPRCEPALNEGWDQTLNWIVNGKDGSDRRSAGGWNKGELDLFVKLCVCLKIFSEDNVLAVPVAETPAITHQPNAE